MHRRSPVFKSIAYSCVIVPVAFYAGITLRGNRPHASEASFSEGAALVPATLQPEQGVIPLREEKKVLEDKRRDIDRKIAELQARTRNERQE